MVLKSSRLYHTDLNNADAFKEKSKRSYFNLKRQNISQIKSKGFILNDIPDNDPVNIRIEIGKNLSSRLKHDKQNFYNNFNENLHPNTEQTQKLQDIVKSHQ